MAVRNHNRRPVLSFFRESHYRLRRKKLQVSRMTHLKTPSKATTTPSKTTPSDLMPSNLPLKTPPPPYPATRLTSVFSLAACLMPPLQHAIHPLLFDANVPPCAYGDDLGKVITQRKFCIFYLLLDHGAPEHPLAMLIWTRYLLKAKTMMHSPARFERESLPTLCISLTTSLESQTS